MSAHRRCASRGSVRVLGALLALAALQLALLLLAYAGGGGGGGADGASGGMASLAGRGADARAASITPLSLHIVLVTGWASERLRGRMLFSSMVEHSSAIGAALGCRTSVRLVDLTRRPGENSSSLKLRTRAWLRSVARGPDPPGAVLFIKHSGLVQRALPALERACAVLAYDLMDDVREIRRLAADGHIGHEGYAPGALLVVQTERTKRLLARALRARSQSRLGDVDTGARKSGGGQSGHSVVVVPHQHTNVGAWRVRDPAHAALRPVRVVGLLVGGWHNLPERSELARLAEATCAAGAALLVVFENGRGGGSTRLARYLCSGELLQPADWREAQADAKADSRRAREEAAATGAPDAAAAAESRAGGGGTPPTAGGTGATPAHADDAPVPARYWREPAASGGARLAAAQPLPTTAAAGDEMLRRLRLPSPPAAAAEAAAAEAEQGGSWAAEAEGGSWEEPPAAPGDSTAAAEHAAAATAEPDAPLSSLFSSQRSFHDVSWVEAVDAALLWPPLAERNSSAAHRPPTRLLWWWSHGVPTVLYPYDSYVGLARVHAYTLPPRAPGARARVPCARTPAGVTACLRALAASAEARGALARAGLHAARAYTPERTARRLLAAIHAHAAPARAAAAHNAERRAQRLVRGFAAARAELAKRRAAGGAAPSALSPFELLSRLSGLQPELLIAMLGPERADELAEGVMAAQSASALQSLLARPAYAAVQSGCALHARRVLQRRACAPWSPVLPQQRQPLQLPRRGRSWAQQRLEDEAQQLVPLLLNTWASAAADDDDLDIDEDEAADGPDGGGLWP